MNAKKRRDWARSLYEKINLAALRLMFSRGTASDVRDAVEWERGHH